MRLNYITASKRTNITAVVNYYPTKVVTGSCLISYLFLYSLGCEGQDFITSNHGHIFFSWNQILTFLSMKMELLYVTATESYALNLIIPKTMKAVSTLSRLLLLTSWFRCYWYLKIITRGCEKKILQLLNIWQIIE